MVSSNNFTNFFTNIPYILLGPYDYPNPSITPTTTMSSLGKSSWTSTPKMVELRSSFRKASYKTTNHPTTAMQAPQTTPTITSETMSGTWILDLTWDDAIWILLCSFMIFAMQTGFGMLEAGIVSEKNVANIMIKNVVDIVFGGFTYWIFGFSLSYGSSYGSSGFVGVGEYVVDSDYQIIGPVFTQFFFQLSFATTATTIVSGTMAERCNFKSYCLFSLLNTIVYCVPCVPARWIWGMGGWLGELGCIDIAGSGGVHLLGGVSGYVAAWMLGPRLGRYDQGLKPMPLGNPTSCLFGLFILWWGWLAFNSGSTFGVVGDKWKFALRAAVTTIISSFGGGLIGTIYTLCKPGKLFDIMDIVNPVLGALVGITAGCALYHTFDALIIGMIGAIVVILVSGFADWTRVDDPVGATAVHGFGGVWGMLAVGFFAEDDQGAGFSKGNAGVFRGSTLYLLVIQMLACICITAWASLITFCLLWGINKVIPIRMKMHEELLGADFFEHLIRKVGVGITPMESALGSLNEVQEIVRESVTVGYSNPKHDIIIQAFNEISGPGGKWRNWGKASLSAATSRSTDSWHSNRIAIVDEGIHMANMKSAIKENETPAIKYVV